MRAQEGERTDWRAEPANTPIVEQARMSASLAMALVFERGWVVAGGWNRIAPEKPERAEVLVPGRGLGRDWLG